MKSILMALGLSAVFSVHAQITPLDNAVFAQIPAGTFVMGSPETDPQHSPDEKQVQVTISRDFEMLSTEVTQKQWFQVMGFNPSYFSFDRYCDNAVVVNGTNLCPDNPVENISWNDAQEFIQKLNEMAGEKIYRLPTEAEWEYAARAGSTSAFTFGDNEALLGDYAQYNDAALKGTKAVGRKKPNAFGLYDIHGSLYEYVEDYYSSVLPGGIDPLVTTVDRFHPIRGGAFTDGASGMRLAYRGKAVANVRMYMLGFRLVRQR